MKQIYAFDSLDLNQALVPDETLDYGWFQQFPPGLRLLGKWKAPKVRIRNPDMTFSETLTNDCSWLWVSGEIPVFSSRANLQLSPLIEGHVEWLPISVAGTVAYALNVTTMIDGLDLEQSQVLKFSDGGIMRIARYAFRTDVVKDTPIFRVLHDPMSRLFVSDEFVQIATRELRGFSFRKAERAGSLMGP